MPPLLDKNGRPVHNPIPENIKTHDDYAAQIATQTTGSKAKKRDALFDYYMRAGLTRQQAARRIERILGNRGIGAPSPKQVTRPFPVDPPAERSGSTSSAHNYTISLIQGAPERRYGEVQLRDRQATFRRAVLSAYLNTCAITGCRIEEILTAAHIIPHSDEVNYALSNGICLRVDIHILFDRDLIIVNPDYTVEVSDRIRDAAYRALHGRHMRMPLDKADNPSASALQKRLRRPQSR